MHQSSMDTMRKFIKDNKLEEGKIVLDIGSYDYNGSYRSLFQSPKNKYIGVDIKSGPGVDVIIGSHAWEFLKDVDAIISGQTFEHVQNVPYLLMQLYAVLKPGGLMCIISPSEGPQHDYPKWYQNFTIKEMKDYVKTAGFIVDSCKIDKTLPFCDLCCMAHKPDKGEELKEKENEDK